MLSATRVGSRELVRKGGFATTEVMAVMHCIYNVNGRVRLGSEHLKKIRAHRIKSIEVEEALSRDPILIYEQDADEGERYVYYGETKRSRLLAIVLTERKAAFG